MASSQQILREYLISLGYKIDQPSSNKFDYSVFKTNVSVMGLGKTLLGVATAAQAFVAIWSHSMEKMYYASRRAESSVGNLKALQYAARTIGISGEAMEGAIEGMARAMRLNPGLQGLIESFGIKVQGRQKADVMIDLIDKLKSMPFYVASQYAGMFGINPDDLLLLEQGVDNLKAAAAARKEMAAAAGLDVDAAAKAAHEYANQLREVEELFSILKDTAAITMLPAFEQVAAVTKEVLRDWTAIMKTEQSPQSGGFVDFMRKIGEGLGILYPRGGVQLTDDAKRRLPHVSMGKVTTETVAQAMAGGALPLGMRHNNPGNLMSGPGGTIGTYGSTYDGLRAMAAQLARYSNRGLNTLRKIIGKYAPASAGNDVGAYIKDVGSKIGAGADQVLDLSDPQKLAALMKAMVAHEQGAGARGIGGGDYLLAAQSARPIMIHQDTKISVTSPDPQTAGRQVASAQTRVGADLVRNLAGQGVPK